MKLLRRVMDTASWYGMRRYMGVSFAYLVIYRAVDFTFEDLSKATRECRQPLVELLICLYHRRCERKAAARREKVAQKNQQAAERGYAKGVARRDKAHYEWVVSRDPRRANPDPYAAERRGSGI
jgi:hypothetical protein